jgi:hypothetical protein
MVTVTVGGCADRERREASGDVPSVSAGKLAKSTVTMPHEGKDLDVLAKLPASERAKIDESFVPVLVPKVSAERVHLVVEPGFFAYSGTVTKALPDGRVSLATVAVQGTRFAHEHKGFPKDVSTHAMRGTRGMFTINEGIATTTWVEHGAGYSVDVECSIGDDARCKDEAFVLELTQGLVFVGGRP